MKAVSEHRSSYERVAITGLGAVCSIGNCVPEIVQGLLSGKSGAKEITEFDAGEPGLLVSQVKNPPIIKADIHPQLARSMGKHLSLLLASTEEALRGAGIRPGMFDPQDMGFFAGMGMVDYHVEDLLPAVIKSLNQAGGLDYDRFFSSGYQEIYPLWPLGMLNNVAFCQASIRLGMGGENCVFSPHGDAGIQAVAEAVKVLEEGKAKVALAGGVSEEISPFSLARARLKGLIRPPGGKPGEDIFLGECGAAVVLEPLSGAVKRGANILATIAGFGFSCGKDDKGDFISGQAVSSAIKEALSSAAFDPERIDSIMLGSISPNELEAAGEIFANDVEAPIMVAAARALGEMFAAGPILNAAIGLSIPDLTALPLDFHCPPVGAGLRGGLSHTGCIMVNGTSYEGRCASMILEKATCETA